MSNVQSYNALIDRFKAFASGHFILKTFSHGQIDTADLEKFTEYPFMHVVPSNVSYAKGTKTFSFQIVLADLPRDKDDKVEFQREVLSDLQRIAEDLIAEITNHRVLFGDLITVQNVSLEPFLEEFHNTLTGWTISLDLLVPYYWDACSIPAEWNNYFESGTGGTGSILSFNDSIVQDGNGVVTLENDLLAPPANYYYGTNGEGIRGWYLFVDQVGLTCQTIGSCQTIIDIEAAIDLLQADMLLKANSADISAVGFSNDYNDLDNLPTIPTATSDLTNDSGFITIGDVPAQVNSDWNATSGVAQILNKPTLTNGTVTAVTATAPMASTGGATPNLSMSSANGTTNGYLLSSDWLIFNGKFNTPDGTTLQYVRGDGSLATFPTIPSIAGLVPYTGATGNVDLGTNNLSANNFFDGFSSVVASGTQIVLTINSVPSYVVTGSGGQTFKMPNATTLPKGAVYYFNNNQSSGAILLNNNSNTLIKSIPSGGYMILELLDNSTAAGSWDTHFQAPSNVSWSTNTFDYGGSITSATWNGVSIADNRIASSATWNAKQDALVSGTNIKTINSTSLLGSGNVAVEPTITAGTTSQYYRGDKTFQTLDKTAVGLSNVDNTSDVNKPVSTATQTALNLKENSANKQNSLDADGTGVKFPTVDAVNTQSMIDKGKRMVSVFSDFIGNVTTIDGLASYTSGSIMGNIGSGIPNRTNQQGVQYYNTLTGATNYALHASASTATMWLGGGTWVYETSINIANLSALTDRYRFISGFGSGNGAVTETDGVFLTYDEGGTLNGTAASPNWQCVTVANSVRTLTTTSTAVTAGAWHKLRIEINAAGTSASFYLNGTLLTTHTTNIPLGSATRFVLVKQGMFKTIGLTNRVIYVDYLGYENILTSPRT